MARLPCLERTRHFLFGDLSGGVGIFPEIDKSAKIDRTTGSHIKMGKSMNKYLIILCLVFSLVSVRVAKAANLTQGTQAAQNWLNLVDSGKYGESWDAAGEYFKSMVKKEDWVGKVTGVRGAIGNVKYRKLISSRHATSLPGAPDGEYDVMRFKSSFANKKKAVETVTSMKDKDGAWRVVGYFIK
jgi:hypothetical protein